MVKPALDLDYLNLVYLDSALFKHVLQSWCHIQEHTFFSSLSEVGILQMKICLLHSDIIDSFIGQGRKCGLWLFWQLSYFFPLFSYTLSVIWTFYSHRPYLICFRYQQTLLMHSTSSLYISFPLVISIIFLYKFSTYNWLILISHYSWTNFSTLTSLLHTSALSRFFVLQTPSLPKLFR